ncbi:hypothetical protein NGRA_2811 [Nosema granulosis]|uniref:Integrase catalytic domain-containing protein n=1 Tax=Nosema granulosis TaxID=83296 RepID=A0A9P6GWE3_9MICR|nr:hypothetical protein NGRA_2811 [Nosema granulosis]
MLDVHKNLNNRGVKGTHYQHKQRYYWPDIKDHIAKILKECETCQIGNWKNKGNVEFVAVRSKGEKFAIDIMKIGDTKRYVLLGKDYFTRYFYGKILSGRSSNVIVQALEEWLKDEIVPENIISDNSKEFEVVEF